MFLYVGDDLEFIERFPKKKFQVKLTEASDYVDLRGNDLRVTLTYVDGFTIFYSLNDFMRDFIYSET